MSDQPATADTQIRLGSVEEFPVGEGVSVDVEEFPVPLAVFNLGDRFRALPDRCPHKGARLSQTGTTPETDNLGGTRGQLDLESDTVACPWHGLEFDLETGDCPATSYQVRPFDVVVDDGDVLLEP